MPSIYALKPRFQQLLRPLLAALHGAGITANAVTVAAGLASLAYGGWLALAPANRWAWGLLPSFLLTRMALNAIDGMLAREYNQQSRLGAVLNEVGDVVADTALYLPFALLPGAHASLVVLVVLLALLSEFVGVVGQVVGGGRRYDGPCGKSDRAAAFAALALAVALGLPVSPYLNYAFGGLVLLLVATCWNRVRQALRAAANSTT
ncbi:CDP-alcohol phosphatidyltransferase family protein [Hymenobacter sp. H14-R3]|uniref:CDP-alcohol phosphatidyltransferase family protein n=1 Tax=Hymenobacter sp. H14-R3 TaxID=3046308 RepID=UPI0024B99BDA|nr:CDP-alcohol phosphatidyltransferase family protein [Hymenobacter sp. H14-R3]MDJ0366107.1 CDP-alcohol phosphatidyltransferase family protein [Hymenobacter sp. H14-R3]